MKMYLFKTPWWLKKIYPSYTWNIKTDKKIIYLTFDDGPHPIATPFVLDKLKEFNARATFFCIGKNVKAFPEIYKRIQDEGHSIGNHTNNHLNGWKTSKDVYLNDVAEAAVLIDSPLFRPPYGRITRKQAGLIKKAMNEPQTKIIMWSLLSGDFDLSNTREKCQKNIMKNASSGSIIVFHDSEKAYPIMSSVLPDTLKYFSGKGYQFESLETAFN
jgi:peptidoglycan/xylan/chitin deacetylase (PgdA/CDA1 family)